MDAILDETSLVPCESWNPAQRIQILASALKALDELGCSRILRSVQNAPDQNIGQGQGLRYWCFDRETSRDAGRFIAQRLGKQPFIDGANGLFAQAEGKRVIEGCVGSAPVIGLAYAALTDSPAIALASEALPNCSSVSVDLITLDSGGEIYETILACRLVTEQDVGNQSEIIVRRIQDSVLNGKQLLEYANDIFPRLLFGSKAIEQISALTGNEPVFHQLFRHLRALDQGAVSWELGIEYSPNGAITWSHESKATLKHGEYGPLRDFPVPEGFMQRRWSSHTKLSGGAGMRLYFNAERTNGMSVVLIGYFGGHLPTVRFGG